VKSLGVALGGLFGAFWVLFFLHLLGWAPLTDRLPLSLYALYSGASALGWAAGAVYVQRTRRINGAARLRIFLLTFFGPPGLLFVLRAMAPLHNQQAAPLVPVWALGVFSLFFFVPVSFRDVGRGSR